MRNFQDTFETPKRSFICAFSTCMTVPLSVFVNDDLVNADTTINEDDELFIQSIVEETADENNENTATPNLSDDPYLQ